MKAIITTGYGSPEIYKLENVAKPTPKSNEILVRIHASSVTKADTMMRTGKPYIGRLYTGLSKPKHAIGGTGFAGVVEAIGADVTLFKEGDRVFGENLVSLGTYAEFVCVSENGIVAPMPEKISYKEAASICDGAITSLNFLTKVVNIKAGQKVLINGASGSLGTAAVQIAKYYGAEVTGVCSTVNKDFVWALGADKVIDYRKEDFTTNSNAYDIIYDTVGVRTFAECKAALTDNGAYISPVLSMPLLGDSIISSMFGSKKAKFAATGMLPEAEVKQLLQQVIKIIEAGKLDIIIDREYPLEQLAEAHTYIDKGHKRGNVVLRPMSAA